MYIIYDISRVVQEDSIIEVILTPVTRGFLFVDLGHAHNLIGEFLSLIGVCICGLRSVS